MLQPLQIPGHHAHPPPPQPSHRRLSEPRNANAMPPNPTVRPPPHQHGGDASYTARRSPSDVPGAATYPHARHDELRMRPGASGVGPVLGHDNQKYLVHNGREEVSVHVLSHSLGVDRCIP